MKEQRNKLEEKINDEDTTENNPSFDKWNKLDNDYSSEVEKLEEKYFAIPSTEKEVFAHCYAEKLKSKLESKNLIPFNRLIDKEKIAQEGLDLEDFKKSYSTDNQQVK